MSLLNLKEAADQLGYSVSGLRKLIRAGRGPRYVRAGGRGQFRFKLEWLDEWTEEEAPGPQPRRKLAKPIINFGTSPEYLDAA